MRAVIQKNKSGHIYGITSIDDKASVVLNDSRLDKGYVTNVLNTYFSNPTHNPFLDKMLYGCPSVCSEQSTTVQPLQPNTEEDDSPVDKLIGDMVGDFFVSMGNGDWREVAWQRKLRRQSEVNLGWRKR